MNNISLKDKKEIKDLIYVIRGKEVMLDSDLAVLYQCKNGTKSINLAVKRHINRFPERFMFQLTKEEFDDLRFQFETANKNISMLRSLPYVFTEQGVAMLSSVLKTEVATQVSIAIMDAFVLMRKYVSNNVIQSTFMENKLLEHDNRISILENTFNRFKDKNNHIFFEGEIYDGYSLLIDILKTATKNIIIIDNCVDKKFLDICSKININVTIFTSKINKVDLEKYNKQYNNIKVKFTNSFHDRFIIIDEEVLYHSGASFKDLGKKCFAINEIEDEEILIKLLEALEKY